MIRESGSNCLDRAIETFAASASEGRIRIEPQNAGR
jgi:hypothetical protein